MEGVLAVVKLNTATLSRSKVNLQVFDRRGGAGNVQFNGMFRYSMLDSNTDAKQNMNTLIPMSLPRSF